MKKEKKQAEVLVREKKQPEPKTPLSERISNYICPMLLGGVLCFIVIYALYRPLAGQYTAIFMIEELLLFMLFDKLKTRKVFGGLLYIVLMVAAVFFALYLLFNGAMSSGYMSPVTWFYGEAGSYSYRSEYLNAVFIGGGFFLISILYYFTQIRYRSLGVMLSLLFPIVIYAKRADTMPDILVTLMISLFLSVMVHNRRIDPSIDKKKRGVLITNTAYIISMAIFVSVTGALTMVIDKPTYFSKLERDSSYFDYYQTQGRGSGNFDDLSEQSSDRRGGLQYTNEPIFNFETDGNLGEYYLRRQAFMDFDGSVWNMMELSLDDYFPYSSAMPEYGIDDIVADVKAVSKDSDALPEPNKDARLITKRKGRVYDEDFYAQYLPAPLGVITDEGSSNTLPYHKYFTTSVIRRSAWENSQRGQRPVMNDSFEFWEQEPSLYSYAHQVGLTGNKYVKKLKKLVDGKGVSDETKKSAKRLLDDYQLACDEYLDISLVEDRLVKLAWDITEDCKSDYEKAKKLEQYFEQNGFEYSLEYVPEDDTIEYFVFESKTGYCVSFATAMTLMARSVNLPARYVEGFAAFEPNGEGGFTVRDGHAHAFVEVYIPGAGWLTFDPTVSDYRTLPEDDDSNFDMAVFLRILSRFIVVIIVGFVIIFIVLLDRIVEAIFRIRLRFADPTKRTLMLYANVIRLVNFSTKEDYSSYTVKMLRKYLELTRATVPDVLFDLFERTAFGGYTPSQAEFHEAYRDYKRCYKYLRRLPRPKELARLKGIPYVKAK